MICFGASTKFCGLTSTQRQILNPIYQKGRQVFDISTLLGFYSAYVGSYGPFGKAYPLKMDPRGCSETSLAKQQSTLRKIPEERRYQILPRRKSEIMEDSFVVHFINVLLLSRYVTSLHFTFQLFTSYL